MEFIIYDDADVAPFLEGLEERPQRKVTPLSGPVWTHAALEKHILFYCYWKSDKSKLDLCIFLKTVCFIVFKTFWRAVRCVSSSLVIHLFGDEAKRFVDLTPDYSYNSNTCIL